MELFEALVKAVHAVSGSVDVVPVSRLTEHGAYNLTLKPAQLYTTRIVVAVSHVPVLPLNGKFSERVMNLVNPDLIFSAHDHQGYLFTADRCGGSWINLQGKKLVRAEEQLEEQVRLVDREFDVFHGTKLRAGQDIKKKTIDFILGRERCGEIPRPVVEIYTNIKFYYRIKYLNLHDLDEKTAKTKKTARDLKKNVHNQF